MSEIQADFERQFFFFQDETNEEDDRLKRECERLFHPERFEFRELRTSLPTIEAANLDTGALFYAQQKRDSESNLESDEESKRVTFEDIRSDTFHRYRKYGRSFSTQDNQIPHMESIGISGVQPISNFKISSCRLKLSCGVII